jgi:protein-disulfide isomerase
MKNVGFCRLACVLVLVSACSGQDRAPPVVSGLDLGRLTTEELNQYRRVLQDEVSPCGGRVKLEAALRQGDCPLAPFAARFVAYRIEQNDSRQEIDDTYLARYGQGRRQDIDIEGAPLAGEAQAPVTLVVFSDFQCPYCSRAAAKLRSLVDDSDGQVRMAFRNFPLPQHHRAVQAAVAAMAAHRQGKFWELHDELFGRRGQFTDAMILLLAEQVGVDVDQFREDLLDPAVEARIREDREAAQRLGVRGTPAIFINGRLNDEPLDRLALAIEEELVRVRMNQPAGGASQAGTPAAQAPSGDSNAP